MGEKDHIDKNWTALDFERYYKNNMSPEERHDLEKSALDDPFLQDALEGYAYTHTPVEDVERLKEKIKPAKKTAPIIWYNRFSTSVLWKVAAILIVFAGFAWIYFANRTKTNSTELAAITVDRSMPDTFTTKKIELLPDQFPTKSVNAETTKVDLIVESPVAKKTKPADKIAPATVNLNSDNKTALIVPAGTKPFAMANSEFRADTSEVVNLGQVTTATRKALGPAKVQELGDASGSESGMPIRGRVLDIKGFPVPYARINRSGSDNSQSSDKAGYFSLNNSGSNLNVKVNALGYETTNAILSPSNPENKVILRETANLALAELKNQSYAAKSKKERLNQQSEVVKSKIDATNAGVKIVNATPVDGWNRYNKRVETLRRQHGKLDTSGIVALSFDIDNKGIPESIKVTKSLTPAADSAAVFILKNAMPLKQIKKGLQNSAVITFR